MVRFSVNSTFCTWLVSVLLTPDTVVGWTRLELRPWQSPGGRALRNSSPSPLRQTRPRPIVQIEILLRVDSTCADPCNSAGLQHPCLLARGNLACSESIGV